VLNKFFFLAFSCFFLALRDYIYNIMRAGLPLCLWTITQVSHWLYGAEWLDEAIE